MQHKIRKHFEVNQFDLLRSADLDQKLLALQKYITKKIIRTTDDNLIRLYLQQSSEIAQQRLSLRKELQQCS